MKINLLGDLHQNYGALLNAIHESEDNLIIQLGDFGIGFGAEQYLSTISPDKLKILFGNHDSPNLISQFPHFLKRFGILELGNSKIFYVGGAHSIDIAKRTPGLDWWYEEQLSDIEAYECIELYENNCQYINIVLSHEAPINVGQCILKFWPTESMTNKLLYELWKIKEPDFHYFGHYHRSFQKKIGNTEFRCLNCNEMIEIFV